MSEFKTKTIKVPQQLFRSATIETSGEGDARTFAMSISSDTPYKRYDYWNDEEYYEVLDHGDGMDTSRLKSGLPILFNHDRDQHLGRAASFSNDGKKCTVSDFTWSESDFAQSKKKDAESGALPDTSVGYQITDEGECIGAKDGIPIYRFKWSPYEASLVTIPADISVGVGRQREHKPDGEPKEIRVRIENTVDENQQRSQTKTNSNEPMNRISSIFHEGDTGSNATTGSAATIDVVKERGDAVIEYEKHRDRLEAHADAVKDRTKKEAPDVLKKFVKGDAKLKPGASQQERDIHFSTFQAEYAEAAFKAEPAQINPELGLSKQERRSFRVVKLMREIATSGYEGVTGLEKEACEAAAKLYRRDSRAHSGFTLPEDIANCNLAEVNDMGTAEIGRQMDEIRQLQTAMARGLMGRALSATNFSTGGALVGMELLTGSIIDLLRNKVIMTGLGITEIGGLVGDIAIPRVTGGATVYWLAEGAAVTESDQTFQQIYFSPHRMGADTAYTKQLLSQASLSVEAFVRDDIAKQMAVEEDRVGFNGSGANGEPLGIFNTSGVGAGVTFGGNATWKTVTKFEYDIEQANADLGMQTIVTTPTTKYYLKITPKIAASTFPIYLWDLDPGGNMINGQRAGLVNGYPAYSTKNVPGNLVVQGVWSEFIKCRWAGIDVVVDPYSLKKSEQVEVTVHQWLDQGVRHPVAFDTSTDAPTSP